MIIQYRVKGRSTHARIARVKITRDTCRDDYEQFVNNALIYSVENHTDTQAEWEYRVMGASFVAYTKICKNDLLCCGLLMEVSPDGDVLVMVHGDDDYVESEITPYFNKEHYEIAGEFSVSDAEDFAAMAFKLPIVGPENSTAILASATAELIKTKGEYEKPVSYRRHLKFFMPKEETNDLSFG